MLSLAESNYQISQESDWTGQDSPEVSKGLWLGTEQGSLITSVLRACATLGMVNQILDPRMEFPKEEETKRTVYSQI